VGKLVIIMIVWIFAFIPTDIFLAVHYFLEPNGFWQSIILIGLGAWILGGFQIMLLIGALGITVFIIAAD